VGVGEASLWSRRICRETQWNLLRNGQNWGSVAEWEAVMRVWSCDVGFWHILVLVIGHCVHVIGHTEVSWRSSVYCGRYDGFWPMRRPSLGDTRSMPAHSVKQG
jgi:hypothetical protein